MLKQLSRIPAKSELDRLKTWPKAKDGHKEGSEEAASRWVVTGPSVIINPNKKLL